MPYILTVAGDPASRLGLAAGEDMDERCVEAAFEAGANYFFFYDGSFTAMVKGLRPLLRRSRERVLVACGSEERDPSGLRSARDRIRKALDLETLDLFHAEYVSPGESARELFAKGGALAEIRSWKESGSVRYVAASVHSRTVAVDLLETGSLDLLMTRYNMAHRGAEEKVLPVALRARVPVTAFTCTRWGSLLKRPSGWTGDLPSAADCYRFALRHPAVRIALTAPGTVKRLYENLSVLRDSVDLPPERFGLWEEFGRQVYGDGKSPFDTRWP